MVETSRHGDVFVVTMQDGENRFNPESLAALTTALDEVEASEGPAALVLSGTGKFFSNGLDLDWMAQAPEGGARENVERTMEVLARVLTFPTAVVAAINGHCFAAGAMLALACDVRVMRADRGFFCLPEIDLGMAFLPGMAGLITAKLSPPAAHEAMLSGRRYGGEEALEAGIVAAVASADELLEVAVERAAALAGKPRETTAAIKSGLFGDVVEDLRRPLLQ